MQVSGLSGAAGGLYQFGATTSRSTELQVTTAEGDRLTMSTSSIRTVGAVGLAAAAGASSVTGAPRPRS
jgi:hypothetical protein